MCLYHKKIIEKELKELNNSINELRSVIIKTSKPSYEKLLAELQDTIANVWDTKTKAALDSAIYYLIGIKRELFNQSDIIAIEDILKPVLGDDLVKALEAPVLNLNERIFKLGINEIGKSAKMKLGFNVTDTEAAAILGKQNLFWCGNYYGESVSSSIDRVLNEYFVGGKTISEVAIDFEKRFNLYKDKGSDYFDFLAEHTTNRVRELGHITGFEKAGFDYYEISAIIDDRTSEICLTMNGMIFPVADGVKFRDDILALDSPDSIKDYSPWRKAEEVTDGKGSRLALSDLPPGMEVPPYHGRCRTTVIGHFSE